MIFREVLQQDSDSFCITLSPGSVIFGDSIRIIDSGQKHNCVFQMTTTIPTVLQKSSAFKSQSPEHIRHTHHDAVTTGRKYPAVHRLP